MMYLKYIHYIIKHKWFVMVECCKRGLVWQGITHDMSKLLPDEFFPYARYFYGNWLSVNEVFGDARNYIHYYKEDAERDFDFAWLLHQKRNRHHWQWWVLREDDGETKTMEMDDKSRSEMLADWIGAGIAITGENNLSEWYSKNKSKMLLHPNTRQALEKEIK